MTFTAAYWQFAKRKTEQFESLDDALWFLLSGLESGSCSPESVTGPHVDLSGEALTDRLFALVPDGDPATP